LIETLWRGSKVTKTNITHHGRKRNLPIKKKITLDVDNAAFRYVPSTKGAGFKGKCALKYRIIYRLNGSRL